MSSSVTEASENQQGRTSRSDSTSVSLLQQHTETEHDHTQRIMRAERRRRPRGGNALPVGALEPLVDDSVGVNEIGTTQSVHISERRLAHDSLHKEKGFSGAAAFRTKRGQMPNAGFVLADVCGWFEHGWFAKPTCYLAAPRAGKSQITSELTGSTRDAFVHFCLTLVARLLASTRRVHSASNY